MKTLNVEKIFTEFEKTITDVSKVAEQITTIEKAISSFNDTEHSFKGKTADSMRAFYHDCHLPFLDFLGKSLDDLKVKLNKIKEAVTEMEPHPHGHIDEDFLSGELRSSFDKTKDVTSQLTQETNDILHGIRDIIDISPVDDSKVINNVEEGKSMIDNIIERLYELDDYGQKVLNEAKEDLDTMTRYLDDLMGRIKNGNIDIENYSMINAIDLNGYRTLIERVHGENTLYGTEIEAILNKQGNGELLTEEESNFLYEYIQNIYLTKEQKNEIHSIIELMENGDIDKLKNRLNNHVLTSIDGLEKERDILQTYMFTGEKTSLRSHMNNYEYAKLESYTLFIDELYKQTLKMEEGNFGNPDFREPASATITKLEYADNQLGVTGNFIDYEFYTSGYFHEVHSGEIAYLSGDDAASDYIDIQSAGFEDELANYNKESFSEMASKELASSAVAATKSTTAGLTFKVVSSLVEVNSAKKELKDKITIYDANSASSRLGLEMSIVNSSSSNTVELYSTDTTYEVVERWKKVNESEPSINVPYEDIDNEDWYAVSQEIPEIAEIYGQEVANFILNGTSDDMTIEEIIEKGKKEY